MVAARHMTEPLYVLSAVTAKGNSGYHPDCRKRESCSAAVTVPGDWASLPQGPTPWPVGGRPASVHFCRDGGPRSRGGRLLRRLRHGDGEERPAAEAQVVAPTDLGDRQTSTGTGASREAQLVARLRSDRGVEREAALAELYQRHGGAVMGFMVACTGNRPLAEKVVQDVFVGLARAPHLHDPSGETLRVHLVTQARWLYVREPPVEYTAVGPWQELPPEERMTLALAHFGGMTRAEVGQVLGVPSDTVAEMIESAIQRLVGR